MRQQKRTRGSHRSRAAAAATSVTLRPLTALIPTNRAGVLFSRQLVGRSLSVLGPPLKGSTFMRVERPVTAGPTVRGEWVRAHGARREDAVLLYIHGSAYALCSSKTHRGITTRLSARTGLPVFACDYRLAPNHAFPCAADDVRAAYEWLIAEGHDPARIVVAGDSAGGHLAVDLSLELIREGRTPPVALALLSPVLDLSLSLAANRERMQRDPMITAARAARLVDLYVAGNAADPRLRFSFDGAADFPPTLVHAGAREMLVGDATELARLLEECGASCHLEIWPDQMHVFQALTRVIPEAEDALERVARFLSEELDVAARRSRLTLVKGA